MYILYMSKTVSISEARANLPALVRAAQQGAEIQITNRGEVVARLVRPANDAGDTVDRLLRARRALAPIRRRGRRGNISMRKSWALTESPRG
jgi:prevent-host-death family protein